MPATITLKNIPDALYARLKAAAVEHRRSVNSEAIVCFETALSAQPLPAESRLRRIREMRASLDKGSFLDADTETLKRQGRP